MPNLRALTSLVVLYSQSSETWICGHCHEFQIALNQANKKKTFTKFSYPEKSRNHKKFKPKNILR